MAIYRTDEDYAKRAALARALREYADVIEQGAPVASSVYWADTPRDPRPLPSSLHITMEQINITFPPASFWRAAIVPYSDPNALDPNGEYHFVRGDSSEAAEQQAAYSTPPPWRDRLKSFEMAQLALAEAYSYDLRAIPDEARGPYGKALKTIAALVQILDERE